MVLVELSLKIMKEEIRNGINTFYGKNAFPLEVKYKQSLIIFSV